MVGYIISGIVGAFICLFICGGWVLLDDWIEKISTSKWYKEQDQYWKEHCFDSSNNDNDIEEDDDDII